MSEIDEAEEAMAAELYKAHLELPFTRDIDFDTLDEATKRAMIRMARYVLALVASRDHTIRGLERASRTRPEYNLRCQDCGAPHWFDTSLPSEVWNRIAEPEDLLCLLCIDERLARAGIECHEAEFYFVGRALRSRLYAESHGTVQQVERERDALLKDLYGRLWHHFDCPAARRTDAPCTCGTAYFRMRLRDLVDPKPSAALAPEEPPT